VEDIIGKLLSKNEAAIYCDLLRYGRSKATEIAKRTKIARNKVYDALDRLAAKGFVHAERGKVKQYFLNDPIRLVEHAERSRQEKEAALKEIQHLLPDVMKMYSTKKSPTPYFIYTRGLKHIIAEIREEIRNTTSFVYIFARRMTFFEDFKLTEAYKALVKRGVDVRVITIDNKKARSIVKMMNAKGMFVPEEFQIKRTMVVKENLFAITLYKDNEEVRIKTDSEDIIEAFRSLFLLFWSMKK
jgi:sugar-specific transcriptional regulator TrmB